MDIKCWKSSIPNSDPKCKQTLKKVDLDKFMAKKDWERYHKLSLSRALESSGGKLIYCPTADCGAIYGREDESVTKLECFKCKKSHCLYCKVEYHKGMTCI